MVKQHVLGYAIFARRRKGSGKRKLVAVLVDRESAQGWFDFIEPNALATGAKLELVRVAGSVEELDR